MKKRLESELISIAHRILKLKNNSELKQLHLETQKLYEALSVLKFVEENQNTIQPRINQDEIEKKLEISLNNSGLENISAVANEPFVVEESNEFIEEVAAVANEPFVVEKSNEFIEEVAAVANEPMVAVEHVEFIEELVAVANEPIVDEEIIVDTNELISEEKLAFDPDFDFDTEQAEVTNEPAPIQISFDEFKFEEPVFEKKSDVEINKPTTLNEKLVQGINIGLNDKVAFIKHLFAGSDTDYNRVLSQISTFDTFYETTNFINEIVKPDYNNWENKDEYVLRFMETIERKFI